MTTPSDEIQKALDTHDKVTLFAQSLKDVRSFVLDKPGRWWLKFNPLFWRKLELKSGAIAEGRSVSGYKVGVTWDESLPEVGTICETSGEPRVYVTQIPTSPIEGSYVVKTRFILPFFSAQRHPGRQVVFCGDSQSHLNYCEQLDLHGAAYSTGPSGELEALHLEKRVHPLQSDVAVLRYLPSLEEISMLHSFTYTIQAYEKPRWEEIDFKRAKSILQCFHESPGSVLGIPYISTKTFLHPKLIKGILDFLVRIGCLDQCLVDTGRVVIHKDSHGIVKGDYTAKVAAKILSVQRMELCRYLKAQNILSSYYPSQKEHFWRYRAEIKEVKFNEKLKEMRQRYETLLPILESGDLELNRFLDRRIEAECLNQKKSGVLIEGGVASRINPTPTKI